MSSPSLPEIAGYRLLRRFDRGAMSEVFLAESSASGGLVAIKLLARGLVSTPKADVRFERERELARRLKHPNLLSVLDAGEFEGRQYFVTEYVDGESLQDRIARQRSRGLFRRNDRARATAAVTDVHILAKVARALDAAHQQRIVHRDVKPGNILVRSDGEPFLIDFGIARRLDVESKLTSTDVSLGTPYYMSPEQLRGDTAHLGSPSDVWGLGATLHEALTGRTPFPGESIEELRENVLYTEVAPLPAEFGSLSKPLAIVVAKALEKDPRHRYASAGEMADELERVLGGKKLRSQAVDLAMRRGWRGFVRRRLPLLVSALCVAIAVASLFAWRSHRARAASVELRVQSLYAEAQSALEYGLFEDALAALDEAAQLDPVRAETFVQRAILYAQYDRIDQARDALARAKSLGWHASADGQGTALDRYAWALELVAERRYGEAEPVLARLTQVDANGPTPAAHELYPAFLTRYHVQRVLGDDDGARKSFAEYRRHLRDIGPVPRVLEAWSLQLAGDLAGAAALLEAELGTEEVRASTELTLRCLRRLGYLYDRLSRPQDSERVFRAALNIDSSDAYSLTGLGIARFNQGAKDEARTLALQGLAHDPDLALSHLLLFYVDVKDEARAWPHLQDAMRCDPSFAQVRLAQACLLVNDARKPGTPPETGRALLLAALDRDPHNVRAMILVGQLEFNEASTRRSDDEEERVATRDPGWWRARVWFDLARQAQVEASREGNAAAMSETERPWRKVRPEKDELEMLRVSSFYVARRLGLADEAAARFNELTAQLDSLTAVNQRNLVEALLRDPCDDCECVRTLIEEFHWRDRVATEPRFSRLLQLARERCP